MATGGAETDGTGQSTLAGAALNPSWRGEPHGSGEQYDSGESFDVTLRQSATVTNGGAQAALDLGPDVRQRSELMRREAGVELAIRDGVAGRLSDDTINDRADEYLRERGSDSGSEEQEESQGYDTADNDDDDHDDDDNDDDDNDAQPMHPEFRQMMVNAATDENFWKGEYKGRCKTLDESVWSEFMIELRRIQVYEFLVQVIATFRQRLSHKKLSLTDQMEHFIEVAKYECKRNDPNYTSTELDDWKARHELLEARMRDQLGAHQHVMMQLQDSENENKRLLESLGGSDVKPSLEDTNVTSGVDTEVKTKVDTNYKATLRKALTAHKRSKVNPLGNNQSGGSKTVRLPPQVFRGEGVDDSKGGPLSSLGLTSHDFQPSFGNPITEPQSHSTVDNQVMQSMAQSIDLIGKNLVELREQVHTGPNTGTNSQRKPKMDIPCFAGEENNFRAFVRNFELACNINGVPEGERGRWLLSKLRGPTITLAECFTDENPPYAEVLKKMVSLYDPNVDDTDHLSSLLTRELQPKETLGDFLRDLDLLMTKAFPDASTEKHALMLKVRFVKGIGERGRGVDYRLYANAKAILKFLNESVPGGDVGKKGNVAKPKLDEISLSWAKSEDITRLEGQIKNMSKAPPMAPPDMSLTEYMAAQRKMMEDMFREIRNQSPAQLAPTAANPTTGSYGNSGRGYNNNYNQNSYSGQGRGGYSNSQGRGGYNSYQGRGGYNGSQGRGGYSGFQGRGVYDNSQGGRLVNSAGVEDNRDQNKGDGHQQPWVGRPPNYTNPNYNNPNPNYYGHKYDPNYQDNRRGKNPTQNATTDTGTNKSESKQGDPGKQENQGGKDRI
jgi:hypothetical protein